MDTSPRGNGMESTFGDERRQGTEIQKNLSISRVWDRGSRVPGRDIQPHPRRLLLPKAPRRSGGGGRDGSQHENGEGSGWGVNPYALRSKVATALHHFRDTQYAGYFTAPYFGWGVGTIGEMIWADPALGRGERHEWVGPLFARKLGQVAKVRSSPGRGPPPPSSRRPPRAASSSPSRRAPCSGRPAGGAAPGEVTGIKPATVGGMAGPLLICAWSTATNPTYNPTSTRAHKTATPTHSARPLRCDTTKGSNIPHARTRGPPRRWSVPERLAGGEVEVVDLPRGPRVRWDRREKGCGLPHPVPALEGAAGAFHESGSNGCAGKQGN